MPRVRLLSAAALAALSTISCSTHSDETIDPAHADAAATGQAFRADVIPVMRRWCSNSSCHADKATTLGIAFPIDDASALYAQLMKESPTAKGARFVVPGNPDASFFYAKIVGDQGDPRFKCDPVGCGETMPPGTKMDSQDRDTIKRWILAGAKDD